MKKRYYLLICITAYFSYHIGMKEQEKQQEIENTRVIPEEIYKPPAEFDTVPDKFNWDKGVLEYQIRRLKQTETLRSQYEKNHPDYQPNPTKENSDYYEGYYND